MAIKCNAFSQQHFNMLMSKLPQKDHSASNLHTRKALNSCCKSMWTLYMNRSEKWQIRVRNSIDLLINLL